MARARYDIPMTNGLNFDGSKQGQNSPLVDQEDAPVPPRYRWLKRFVILTTCLLFGVLLLRIYWGFEANRKLQSELDSYRSAGQPVYANEFDQRLDAVSDEGNAAVLLEEAVASLTMVASSGVSINDFVVDPQFFVTKKSDAAEVFNKNKPVLAMIHESRSKPNVSWSERLRDTAAPGFRPMLGTGQRNLARLLWFAATYQRQIGNDGGAIQTIHDFVSACESIESHPTLVANLVSGATYDLAFTLIEDATVGLEIEPAGAGWLPAHSPASREQMEALLATLVDEREFRRSAINASYGDRAQNVALIKSLDSRDRFGTFGGQPWHLRLWDRLVHVAQRPLYVLDLLESIRESTLSTEAIAQNSWPDAKRLIPATPENRTLLTSMTRPMTDSPFGNRRKSTRKFVQIHFKCLARRRMAATTVAILLFEKDHARRPVSLAELVPNYLPIVPADPFSADRADIRYEPRSEYPVLYSVGPNESDDGGQVAYDEYGRCDWTASDILFELHGRRPRGSE